MNKIPFKIKKITTETKLPTYVNHGDAGKDVFSQEDKVLAPNERHLFKLGFMAEFPEGYVALIWDKSGLAAKNGLTTLAGVIDSHYRGEYGVVILNTGAESYTIKKGDKISQLLLMPILQAEISESDELSDTQRGEGEFGSTGK